MRKLALLTTLLAAGTLSASIGLAQQTQPGMQSGQEARQEQTMGQGAPLYVGPNAVRQIQQSLQQAGHDPGGVDGIWGSGTQSAVRSFQQSKGLPTTGNLNFQTLSALGIDVQALAQADQPSGAGVGSSGQFQQPSGASVQQQPQFQQQQPQRQQSR